MQLLFLDFRKKDYAKVSEKLGKICFDRKIFAETLYGTLNNLAKTKSILLTWQKVCWEEIQQNFMSGIQ